MRKGVNSMENEGIHKKPIKREKKLNDRQLMRMAEEEIELPPTDEELREDHVYGDVMDHQIFN